MEGVEIKETIMVQFGSAELYASRYGKLGVLAILQAQNELGKCQTVMMGLISS